MFSYLRYKKQAIKFASLKLLFIVLNIGLNLLYFLTAKEPQVGYVFYINLCCTAFITLFFAKEITALRFGFDAPLMKRMLRYSWPILILGLAGILNQTADKILYPIVCPGEEGKVQLGIYGAVVKIAMIMAMITQAFRYAYEPFVFGKTRDKDNDYMQATAMKYYVIFTLLAFLSVVAYIDIIKYVIAPDYWVGLRVVPIVMAAEIMMGIYFNLSFWYKLEDKTYWGAIFSTIGCSVIIVGNLLFVPRFGYIACAWAGFAGYLTSMLLSYIVGFIYHPISYPRRSMSVYVLMSILFYALMHYGRQLLPQWASMSMNTVLIMLFVAHLLYYDLPVSQLPVIGNLIKRRK